MKGVYIVHHMKRSGGHAVVNWLLANAPKAVFVNNEVEMEFVFTGRLSIPDGSLPYAFWLQQKQKEEQFQGTLGGAPAVLVSLEDHELDVRPFHHARAQTILIVRHPENLFASRIRKASRTRLKSYNYKDEKIRDRVVRIWKEHARAALRADGQDSSLKVIFYDAWLTGQGYRTRLAEELGFDSLVDPTDQIAEFGGGSSFGDRQANAGDLLRRADSLSKPEARVLKEIMADPELRDLAAQFSQKTAELTDAY